MRNNSDPGPIRFSAIVLCGALLGFCLLGSLPARAAGENNPPGTIVLTGKISFTNNDLAITKNGEQVNLIPIELLKTYNPSFPKMRAVINGKEVKEIIAPPWGNDCRETYSFTVSQSEYQFFFPFCR
ncbi:MAG: hypothetical protein P4L62_03255 [Candidatus Pacebacteria bacterium]|nr:hypothetical protein [Candidatus Paceibacterota bacterium]